MAEYIKAWTTVLFLALEVTLLIGIISATLEICKAQQFHSDVIAEIENSNFNAEVMESCKSQAAEEGYTLTLDTVVTEEEDNRILSQVTLTYPYKIGILNLTARGKVYGVAR